MPRRPHAPCPICNEPLQRMEHFIPAHVYTMEEAPPDGEPLPIASQPMHVGCLADLIADRTAERIGEALANKLKNGAKTDFGEFDGIIAAIIDKMTR